MDGITQALLRTTLCTLLAAGIAKLLLRTCRVRSPAVHRLVWAMVLLQGWAFAPLVLKLTIPNWSALDLPMEQAVVRSEPMADLSTGEARSGPSVRPAQSVGSRFRWPPLLWLAGALAVVGRYSWRYTSMLSKIPLGRVPTREDWRADWDAATRGAKIQFGTQFRLTDNVGPLCCFVPCFYLVLAPERLWTALAARQRRAILKHEFAHLARWDLWKSAAIRVLALPQWFNPAAWSAVRAFDEAAEWACDDMVMSDSSEVERTCYPIALLRIAEFNLRPLPGSAAARGGVLSTRIRRLLQPRFMEETKMAKFLIPMLLFGVVLAQSVRIETVAASDDPNPPPPTEKGADASSDDLSTNAADRTERRKRDLERTGLLPYRISPPDVVRIRLSRPERIPQRGRSLMSVVGPDGTIVLHTLVPERNEPLNITGKTVKEVERAVRETLPPSMQKHEVAVEVVHKNSKVVYVLFKANGGDQVFRWPCQPDSTVKSVLAKSDMPHPIDFHEAEIEVRRPRGAGYEVGIEVIPVRWGDIEKNDPELLPGDRVMVANVDLAGSQPAAGRAVPVPLLPTTTSAKVTRGEGHGPMVKLQIQVLEDSLGNLEEFEALKRGSVMLAEATQTAATIRILTRNKLVKMLAYPQVACQSGNRAHFSVGDLAGNYYQEPISKLAVDVSPTIRKDSRIKLETKVHVVRGGKTAEIDTAAVLSKGQTLLLRAHPTPQKEYGATGKSAIYVALTPEVVR